MPPHLSKASVFQTGLKAVKHSQVRKLPVSNAVEEAFSPDEWVKQELAETEVQQVTTQNKRKFKDDVQENSKKLKHGLDWKRFSIFGWLFMP